MKWYIGSFKWKKYNNLITEYYISDSNGNIIAGDFTSYNQAKRYITTTLTRSSK